MVHISWSVIRCIWLNWPMSAGVVMVAMQLTLVIGECVVIVLQVVRILAEEKLLLRTIPTYGLYMKSSRYRLIPLVW